MKKAIYGAAIIAAFTITGAANASEAFRCNSLTGWCTMSNATNTAALNTANIQSHLIALGYHIPGGANGIMNPSTRTAVKAFQRDFNLNVDGIVGTQTASALNAQATRKDWSTAYSGTAYGYYGPVVMSGFTYGR